MDPPRGPANGIIYQYGRIPESGPEIPRGHGGGVQRINYPDNRAPGPGNDNVRHGEHGDIAWIIHGIFHAWLHGDFPRAREMWHQLLQNKGNSQGERKLIWATISSELEGIAALDDFRRFLEENHLHSPCITQQQHTQHLCTLLESLHSRISALEERA
jgi:hypothetical protein